MGMGGRLGSLEELEAIRNGEVPGKTLVSSVPADPRPKRWRQCSRCGRCFWLADEMPPPHGGVDPWGVAWTCRKGADE